MERTDMLGDAGAYSEKAPALRVLIVDDDARVRRSLRSLIECAPDLTVVGEAGSAVSTQQLDLTLVPDVVVLDLLLPRASDGIDVLRALRRRNRPVVAISAMSEMAPMALAAGAHTFFDKHARGAGRLLDMIRAASGHHPDPPVG
jgi:DNA-binding NarL/FixJ family response regulator